MNSESKVEVQADDFNIMNVPDEIDMGSFFKKPKEVNVIQQYEAMMATSDIVKAEEITDQTIKKDNDNIQNLQ